MRALLSQSEETFSRTISQSDRGLRFRGCIEFPAISSLAGNDNFLETVGTATVLAGKAHRNGCHWYREPSEKSEDDINTGMIIPSLGFVSVESPRGCARRKGRWLAMAYTNRERCNYRAATGPVLFHGGECGINGINSRRTISGERVAAVSITRSLLKQFERSCAVYIRVSQTLSIMQPLGSPGKRDT